MSFLMTFRPCFEVLSKRWSGSSKVDHRTSNSTKKWPRDIDFRCKPGLSHTVQDHLTWSTWAWYLCFFRSTSRTLYQSRLVDPSRLPAKACQPGSAVLGQLHLWLMSNKGCSASSLLSAWSVRAGRWSLLSAARGRFRLLPSAAPDLLHYMMIRRRSNKSIYIYIYIYTYIYIHTYTYIYIYICIM